VASSVHNLDIRGAIIPITLLKVVQAFREIVPGETLEILGNDSDTQGDIFQVLKTFHYRLTVIEQNGDFYRIRLKKE